MDKKIYENTRYQNIYRNKKNKNYIISISTPVKTSISKYNNSKIYDINEAKKIRDDILVRQQKAIETLHKENFDDLWVKYIYNCKYIQKLSYNTLIRKSKTYNRYFKNKIIMPISKTTKEFWAKYINDTPCSDKQKNELLKLLKAFFNWCINEDILLNNPVNRISKYKEVHTEMKYWLPNELQQFLITIDKDLNSDDLIVKKRAYLIKMFTTLGFSLGDRVGESRALTFDCVDFEKLTITIKHSINYDLKSNSYFSHTKTAKSQRIIDISQKIADEIINYKFFLSKECNYDVKDTNLIFFNYEYNKPYSDVALRKKFNYYCNKANVPVIRMYDLRHTYVATMMAEGQELYLISLKLGHTNYNTTLKKYGHISNEVKRKIANATDKYIQ